MPSLLRAIVNDLLSAESDFVVVGHSLTGDDPLVLAAEQGAELIITRQGTDSGSSCVDAIVCRSPLSIFAISPDGETATAINLLRSSVPLETVERDTLAHAIRRVAVQARGVDFDAQH